MQISQYKPKTSISLMAILAIGILVLILLLITGCSSMPAARAGSTKAVKHDVAVKTAGDVAVDERDLSKHREMNIARSRQTEGISKGQVGVEHLQGGMRTSSRDVVNQFGRHAALIVGLAMALFFAFVSALVAYILHTQRYSLPISKQAVTKWLTPIRSVARRA